MKSKVLCAALIVVAASAVLRAQTAQTASNDSLPPAPITGQYALTSASPHEWTPSNYSPTAFSRMAFGGGVSTMGVNMQVAVNANRYMNIRGTGNFFNYSLNNISTNGLLASGKLNFASAGASVDFYPFPFHGFRLSPGVLFYNQNQVTASITAPGGTSFSLDDYTYYSSKANPVTGTAGLGLNTQKQAFTMTTGWGNMIPRKGGHFSVPIEIGAAFVGTPSLTMALTGGQVCQDPAGTIGCMNVVGNSQIQSSLAAQQAKYQNDLNPLKIYPIFTTGIAYSFSLRGGPVSQAARPR